MESANEMKQMGSSINLTHRRVKCEALTSSKGYGIKRSFNILREGLDDAKLGLVEQFKVVLTDRTNKLLGMFEVSTGGISGTVADTRLIFAAEIKGAASGILLKHNRLSVNVTPSQVDMDLTRKIAQAGKFLEIQVLDHIILTSEKYYSLVDEGIL